MNINIKEFIKSLNLIFYEFDSKENSLIKDVDYSNKHTKLEFFKITYYLSKERIPFNVVKDKTITFKETSFNIKEKFSIFIENFKNNSKNIFLLNDKKVQWAKNIPLFKITFINKEIDFTKYDAIVFTSKNAIKAINSINKNWKKIPSYVISEQTAKLVKDLDGKLEYISKTKHGNEFAYEILNLLKGKKVLYLRGEEIVSDFLEIMKDNSIDCKDEIIYKNSFNEKVKKVKIPKNSKIIFTSPSTVKYFFKIFSWDKSYKAISIGKTTAQYIPKDINTVIADNTSFKSCVNKALETN
ncbi:uroporphyrinogen-III synthase [Poseidonibacter ostreae]|jgi:uroporphyrinogen-III synthase|uniref:Uroporphyrinogen-III synthase n=1 Tax=Poseidonibacter ostreae TaxID=2654171 RepID=A0A6L4WXN9_9BACT|nr:uroporphyrinogen-III synthase [Poseidonibacter ostreae]KAB7887980.1 uroporphyrinogen-III synthase [Poseidonibacter ostreae]KAB7891101.1 uroporphyrinogen-III synthase [Poseidonibacter ostreae]KAB7892825.1 uroporphyrinogen-III synthase [Poseidonibacter ostreae]MAC83787.1 uroporphyrinogen-III synthase [Arcobacter sp.]|tara:strand:- start:5542 stop:6435 length:894 start_codon:yes stop_codon:yes gene_type:complete